LSPWAWLRRASAARLARDPAHGSLRRAARAAIVFPSLFAFGDKVVGNPQYTLFAAFGSFALVGLVEFSGTFANRLRSQLVLAAVAGLMIVIGTLVSQTPWRSAAVMFTASFFILFAGVVSSQIARASTSIILPLIVATALPASPGQLTHRLAGFATAALVSLVALRVLWPVPTVDPLRPPTIAACRSLASWLRNSLADHERQAAIAALDRTFLTTPFRPTGLSTQTRQSVRLVEELDWLDRAIGNWGDELGHEAVDPAAADVLDGCAHTLEKSADRGRLAPALGELRTVLDGSERAALADAEAGERQGITPEAFVSRLVPSFRAQELTFAVEAIAGTVEATVAAEGRSWWSTLLGHQAAAGDQLVLAGQRTRAHLNLDSIWLRNSLRGATALAVATLVADKVGVQHSFWVVFGALSVLRSNALSTGQFVSRAIVGTIAGFVVGGALISIVGTNTDLLWAVLPLSVLLGGLAPTVVSFAVGQAAFTVTILLLFTIIAPDGWRIGVVRVEDVALGCAVSLVVALVFWPRGAGAQLRTAIGDAYSFAGQYLAEAVAFASACCSFAVTAPPSPPTNEATRAAEATRRLDDAFRNYLAERGAKPMPLAEITNLLIGSAALRLTADAVLAMWRSPGPSVPGTATEARGPLVARANEARRWFDQLAKSLAGDVEVAEPLAADPDARRAFLDALAHDLAPREGRAATAARLVWTDLALGAALDVQRNIVDSARLVVRQPVFSWRQRLSATRAYPGG
jgi:uncharacterized membrane protein YccC